MKIAMQIITIPISSLGCAIGSICAAFIFGFKNGMEV